MPDGAHIADVADVPDDGSYLFTAADAFTNEQEFINSTTKRGYHVVHDVEERVVLRNRYLLSFLPSESRVE